MAYLPLPSQYQIQYVEHNLNSAAILNLLTPYTLVPAQGGDKLIVPVSCVLTYDNNGTPYTNPLINFGWGGANASFSLTNLLSSASDTIRTCVPGNNAFALDNTAFTVRAPVAPLLGDGTIKIRLAYYIADVVI